ncbi:MAG: sugar phosphate isomerase/epimerase [Oscillospiraceae bacterium]|jgi:fatty-acyl-CoA synthase|nr:sugar phosphate isomerase/epimerase [Oscillospiraceae bacterium]
MKLSFSTIGCPGWSFSDVTSTARDTGFDGIELRGIGHVLVTPRCPEFAPDRLDAARSHLESLRLAVPVVSAGSVLGAPALAAAGLEEAKEAALFAAKINAPYIRVMCSGSPEPVSTDLELCARELARLCDFCADFSVVPLIETNGALAQSEQMLELLECVSRANLGILWDIHHPYRFFGEAPAKTLSVIGKYVRHVHVKDSVPDVTAPKGIRYKMMGEGDVPVENAVLALKNIGYSGFLSLEWVKRWNPDLEEPGIVFAQYKHYMEGII